MKKFLPVLLSLIIILGGCPAALGAKIIHEGNCGRYVVWKITDAGVLNIVGVGTMQYEFSTDERFSATPPWEQYKADIVSIYVSDNITDIGNGAFYGCRNVEEIRLPQSLTHIYKNAFASCRSLRSVELSDKIHYIGESAFENCTSLVEINIPDEVTEISPNTFNGCTNLEKVVFNDKLESIGYCGFGKCEKLKNIEFPGSLKSLGENSFVVCNAIDEIHIPESVREIGEGVFSDCAGLKKVTISAYVERIGRYIFKGCSNLNEVHLPHSVNYISDSTFNLCGNLKDIYYDGTLEEWNFAKRVAHISMDAPDHTVHCLREPQTEESEEPTEEEIENGETSLPETDNETEPEEGNTAPEIEEELPFDEETSHEKEEEKPTSGEHGNNISWNYKDGVLTLTGIGRMDEEISRNRMGWDDYREEINEIIISDGITSICEYAFWKCENVEEIVIPGSVTEIGRRAFSRCEYLNTVVIPASVKIIDKMAFSSCDNLTILCEKGSVAHDYAKDRKIDYELTDEEEKDFKTSDWAKTEIIKAYENNLIPESMIEMDLTKVVTREEFVAIAVRLYKELNDAEVSISTNPFLDVNKSKYLKEILAAYYLGITMGTTQTTFEPENKITREQLATMLCRVIKASLFDGWTLAEDSKFTLEISDVPKFEDDADISEYAKPSVYFMYKKGIIKGVSNSKFAPKNMNEKQENSGYAFATIEQALIMALRTFEVYKTK